MKAITRFRTGVLAGLAACVLAQNAAAATSPVFFNQLVGTDTVATPLGVGDDLFVDTLVTTETGPLSQTVTFTVAAGVTGFTGTAAWLVWPADSTGPRLVGVNIDILDAGDTVIFSDTFQGLLANFAHSTLGGPIAAGTYRLVATGTGVRTSSLDVSLVFVPEPGSAALLLLGLGALGATLRRGART